MVLDGVTRREYVAGAGAAALSGRPRLADAGDLLAPDRDGGRRDFLWLHGGIYGDERTYENLLAYARRHDLVVILSAARTTPETATKIAAPLARAEEFGVTAWLASGCFTDEFTAGQLATEGDARATFLDRLGSIAETYASYMPEGRFVCWHEEPLVSQWAETGQREAQLASMVENGPAIFAAQKDRIQQVSPDVGVGIFIHFPYIAEGDQFERVMAGLRERDALPDFTFADFYRGYREPEGGVGAANAVLRALVATAKEHTDGRDLVYLGEDHTINNSYTPSKQAIRENLRSSLAGEGADGLGWYVRSAYRRTDTGFDPFLPNTGSVDEGEFNTFTGSRDRFHYAYRLTHEARAGFDPAGRFDLWVHGRDLDFQAHRLSLRTAGGEWEFVGDLSGYVDGDNPYTADGREWVSVFHALDRSRFVSGGELGVRIESEDGDGGRILTVAAMPYDTGNYLAEHQARALVREGGTDLERYALGTTAVDAAAGDGETTTATVPVGRAERDIGEWLYPDTGDLRARLAAAEAEAGVSADSAIDIWVSGSDLDAGEWSLRLEQSGDVRRMADLAVATVYTGDLAVFYGVDRDVMAGYRGGGSFTYAAPEGGPAVDLVMMLPYFGRDNFVPPARAAALVDDDPLSVRSFAHSVSGWVGRVDPPAETTTATSTATAEATTAETATDPTETPSARTATAGGTATGESNPGTPGVGALGALLGVGAAGALRLLRGDD